ncbi:MAG: S41 family peptidase, partial [Chloroflexia bacterium]|nr:S41 family peptidase [Chloroflexia bacterium]
MAESSPFAFLRLRLPLWVVSTLLLIVLVGSLSIGLLVGFLANRSPVACPESPEVCEEFAVFWEAWELSRSRFVDAEAANPEVMIAGAITGMVDSLGDQGHTRFLTASEAEAWDTSL